MSLEEFLDDPWDKGSPHKEYTSSFVRMRPAPAMASGEVVLAATYRQVGFSEAVVSEKKVSGLGREFRKNLSKRRRPAGQAAGFDPEAWNRIISGSIRSPKQPNQSKRNFLLISPVVPDAALYSQAARLTGSPWDPGELVAQIVAFGSRDADSAQETWERLFEALSVGEEDDVWARFLQREFETWRTIDTRELWDKPNKLGENQAADSWHKSGVSIPASRFVHDLEAILSLKQSLTRRQWTSMLESMLRLGTASHILWICSTNTQCFKLMKDALREGVVPSDETLKRRLGVNGSFWRYGQLSSKTISEFASEYLRARLGLNLLLWELESEFGQDNLSECLANVRSISELLCWLAQVRKSFKYKEFWTRYRSAIEDDPPGKKSLSRQLKHFLQHVLGQRQTAERGLDSYDQGYFLAKRGSYSSAPWEVSLGPVSVLSLVFACTRGGRGARTVEDLCRHLGEYGLKIEAQDVPESRLGQTLRNLGLVLDSPDAEGGMVVVNPFERDDRGDVAS